MNDTRYNNQASVCLIDYLRMLKKRGPRLPLCFFINAHLYDLIYKTDTHNWVPKDQYDAAPENFEHGFLYMASWTLEIKRSFNAIHSLIDDLNDFNFLDIGCGKGKVVLVWQQLLNKFNINQIVYGIDYHNPFIASAESNHNKLFSNSGNFLCADATKLDYNRFGQKLIIYMYNPFNENILTNVLRNLKNEEVYVIYNNPVHSTALIDFGYQPVFQHIGFCPNCQTIIFKRSSK